MTPPLSNIWDPGLYQSSHAFVWQLGRDLLPLLAPEAGEKILDIGCGTGQLTAQIAESGAYVLGIDKSASMVERARQNYPAIPFEVHDATALPFNNAFDAVFSNAVLHWVTAAEQAVARISQALRAGGRFVAEFGGYRNIEKLNNAGFDAMDSIGKPVVPRRQPMYFPRIGEYCSLLERHGLIANHAALFDRPTRLENGTDALAKWFEMFGGWMTGELDSVERESFNAALARFAEPALLIDGIWHADYRRIRVVAVKE